ncbi:MAG: ribonuclease HII [Chloroflexi bacterium]|nr:MAG: ribonuclease HII [Chloroflexota bacterium]
MPDLQEERTLWEAGYRYVAGLDEAGRGAWAGPVYAAAVILPPDRPDLERALDGVTDSKALTPEAREALLPRIRRVALSVGVGWAGPEEIDALGIVAATRLAMARALEGLRPAPNALLLDYLTLPEVPLPQRSLPKADARSLSVAAASIVAKVSRDRRMVALDARYPGYGFARHKGYGTRQHREALARLGVSPIHRRRWKPIQAFL